MIYMALAAVNVGIAMSPLFNPNLTWLNWSSAVFCFGLGLISAIENAND